MGTALTPEQSRLLARFADEVVLGYDGDAAGETACRRALPLLLAETLAVRRARMPEGGDPDSLRLGQGEAAVRSAVDEAEDFLIAELRRTYGARVAAMDEALHQHLGGIATWQKPQGGYFFWVTLPPDLDAEGLQRAARSAGTGYQLGSRCSVTGGLRNCVRLSFAFYSEPEIREGVARLGKALRAVAR